MNAGGSSFHWRSGGILADFWSWTRDEQGRDLTQFGEADEIGSRKIFNLYENGRVYRFASGNHSGMNAFVRVVAIQFGPASRRCARRRNATIAAARPELSHN